MVASTRETIAATLSSRTFSSACASPPVILGETRPSVASTPT